MKELTGTTWGIILLFVIFVIVINVWLLTFSKEKKTKSTVMILRDSMNILKDPFQEENKNLEELATLTSKLKETNSDTQKGDENA